MCLSPFERGAAFLWSDPNVRFSFSICSLIYNNYYHHINIGVVCIFVSGTKYLATGTHYQNLVPVSGTYVMGIRYVHLLLGTKIGKKLPFACGT